jgi:hypothetical protein
VDAGLILSATQFVAVRNRVGKTDDQLGLVMDWVSIESQ